MAREARPVTAAEAAALVGSGDWVDYGATLGQPDVFDRALAARAPELRDVRIRSCLSLQPRAVLEADPHREHFQFYSWHFSAYDRRMHDAGLCHYIPCNLGEVPDYYLREIEPPDLAVIKTCPMDADRNFNLSVSNLWHRAVAARARRVIVETCPGLPYVPGAQNSLPADAVDYVIEGDAGSPPELPNSTPGEVDRAVAQLIAAGIEDGACLQVGIGAMPNAVCSLLLDSGVRNLGVHTEMLTEGIIDLYRRGLITGARKALDPGLIAFSFAVGTRKLYETVHRNPDFVCYPVDYTNLPHRIMQNTKVVAINNTTEMDLQGQAASECSGHRHISGTGGQAQFVRGAYASPGGKSFLCLSSTYERHGVRKSRIVTELAHGNIVTTTRADMMYVVTEYGIVNLKGMSVPERARAMISLAHPDFREALQREARARGLLPRGH